MRNALWSAAHKMTKGQKSEAEAAAEDTPSSHNSAAGETSASTPDNGQYNNSSSL